MADDADFTDKKILIVDDDARNVFAISSILKTRGMTVISAETGKVAIELLSQNPDIDLILMDQMMPDMDGLDATRHIRNMPQFLSLPIITLTAKAMKGDREKALAAGASDYITKPVDVQNLLAIMYMWLKKTRLSRGMKMPLLEERVNILVVDDRADGLLTLEAVLKRPDYNIVEASSA